MSSKQSKEVKTIAEAKEVPPGQVFHGLRLQVVGIGDKGINTFTTKSRDNYTVSDLHGDSIGMTWHDPAWDLVVGEHVLLLDATISHRHGRQFISVAPAEAGLKMMYIAGIDFETGTEMDEDEQTGLSLGLLDEIVARVTNLEIRMDHIKTAINQA